MKKYEIEFSNGYCGCDITEEFEGTYEEAEAYAKDNLYDYANDYGYCAFGWDNDYTDEEFEEYLENCSYCITEVEGDE